ncbi:MAG: type II toxin-antitoxin system RelE/ParE family toxin [Actinomycetota bacterium]|nr:type II toxin-antitoxin system RelE/ParE family toxin [Actinomycetota bacterium]
MTDSGRYSVGYDTTARKELDKLDRQVAKRVARAISALGTNPRPAGCRRLVGYDDLWRLRVGDYRIIYTIRDTELIVLALRIAHRSDVYRRI